ncbi:ferric reduction oxidase 7, chloroplastic-like isoform X2 [Punica granatum]|uniref:Ferric reduction oxidase 7, chloroplastic-like isoform X2 n=1 Tax=Punica granatum TaxID=22663 RepID=A0A6P8C9N5_PUNGR|nr:ferric reduction oxidase 7, chloroplastic-like isoform X2 [Punica granatum]
MAELSESVEEHLLSYEDPAPPHSKLITTTRLVVKWVLEIAMGLIFAAWLTLVFIFPVEPVNESIIAWLVATSSPTYGFTGSTFFLFSGPILVITFLAIARLIVMGSREEELLLKNKSAKHPRLRLWTFPVLVNGPFGVVSAAEFIGICLVFVYVLWAISAYTLEDISIASLFSLPPLEERYHVWLGHLTMMLFTLHGLFFVIAWAMEGTLINEITSWGGSGVAIFPGVISLLAGLLMWVTSLPPVRKKQFEVFFYTHQLYVVFVVFLALHVGDYTFCIACGGIFLFMLDRFLRFCQSRRTVNVISATRLPCGIIELVLSKPENLQYNALSFIFIRIRELSWLQWHPFSVSSSPLDGKNRISVIIKVLGKWTAKLDRNISDIIEIRDQNETAFQPHKITASVEGPYGHELPYHLTYKNLVLVAGGIGVSPFFAILSDILHRVGEGKPCLPRKVLLVWAIKKSNELPLLSTLDMESICPFSPYKLNLEIDVYITRESEPSLEEGNIESTKSSHVFPISNGHGMSVLVGTGNNIWLGLYVMSSVVGFIVLMSLLNIFYINHFYITNSWYRGLLFVVCMLVSVIVFGGLVVFLWSCWEKHMSAVDKSEHRKRNVQTASVIQSDSPQRKSVGSRRVLYGSRPNFQEILGSLSDLWGHVDIGVIVCGPATLEASVAKECRSRNLKRGSDSPIFHFHSHTFDL